MTLVARIALLLGLVTAGPLYAAGGSCSLLNSPTLDFGGYSALGGARNAEASLLMNCLPRLPALTVSYILRLDGGSGGAGFFPRRLRAGGYSLEYNLYRDVARSEVWGDGTAGTLTVAGNCTAACSTQIYGRLPAGQSVPAARYSDQVLITIEF